MTAVEIMRRPSWAMEIMGRLRHHNIKIYRHSIRAGLITHALWKDFTGEDSYKLRIAGFLHDCGKIENPPYILEKDRTTLNAEEIKILSKHPDDGADMVAKYDKTVANIIRGHHRWGNNGEEHPLRKRDLITITDIERAQMILAIADKADVAINRTIKGLLGVSFDKGLTELLLRFEKEIKESVVTEELLRRAVHYARNAGAIHKYRMDSLNVN